MAENGSCAWPKCKDIGNKWQDGKCYCERHYVMVIVNNKPVGKPAMCAGTAIINDSG